MFNARSHLLKNSSNYTKGILTTHSHTHTTNERSVSRERGAEVAKIGLEKVEKVGTLSAVFLSVTLILKAFLSDKTTFRAFQCFQCFSMQFW